MTIVLDLAVAAILVIATIAGVKNGFIKSVIGLIGLVAAAVLALLFCTPLANAVYSGFVEEPLTQAVREATASTAETVGITLQEQVDATIERLPDMLRTLLGDNERLKNLDGGALPADKLATMFMDLLSPVCVTALQIVIFLILFILLLIAVKIVGGLLDKVFSALPVIRQANGLLGGVVGFAEGVLLVFVLGFAIELYMTFAGADAMLTRDQLSQTMLLKLVMSWNPFV